jgi:serine/threonine protein kinase
MCLALNVIHTNNLVHLDVKPDNIFIKDDKFKLGDFGLANSIDAGDTDEGDNRYMAREMLSFYSVDRDRCDIFSLGATMYRICLGRELPGSGDEWNDIRNGTLDELDGTHPEMKRFIAEMMHPDPSCRPTAKELLTREFLLSEQEKQLLAQRRQVQELEEQLRRAQLQAPTSGLVRSSSIL